jgi:predicted lipid-binding transport protein (Tim44 family)
MTEKSLRVLYSIGLGIIIVLFVGLGIATFYPAPADLPYSSDLSTAAREAARTTYEAAMKDYNRNVTVAALASALLILGASIWSESKKPLFAGGFLLGGLLTLIYGLMRGLTSGVTAVAFFSVTVGLVVVIYLGHQRFFSARAVAARAKARENDRAAYPQMPIQPQYAPAPQAQQPSSQAPAGFPYAAGQPYQPYQPGQPYPQHGQYPAQAQPMQQPYPPQQGQYPPETGDSGPR